jgi:dienelactone hydrolase
VGTRIMNFTDPSRREMHAWALPGQRELVTQLWYPARDSRGRKAVYRRPRETSIVSSYQAVLETQSIQDAVFANGIFPIVMFNHAWGGFRNRSTFLAQELASHGFVVVAVSHTYNSRSVELPGGRVAYNQKEIDIGFWATLYIPLKERLHLADTELRIHTDDCNFVLQQLSELNRTSGHWLENHLETNCVSSVGQSFGGAVAAQLAKENPSVRSALSLDGVIHGSLLTESLNKPIMFLDSIWLTEFDLDENDPNVIVAETAVMWKMISDAKKYILRDSGGLHIVIKGTQHQDFTDAGFMSPLRSLSHIGSLPPERSAAIINSYVLAFLRQTLCDKEEPILCDEAQPFPEATLTVWHGLASEQDLCTASATGSKA